MGTLLRATCSAWGAGALFANLLTSQLTQAQSLTVSTRTPARQAVAAPVAGPVQVQFSQPVSTATAGDLRVFGGQRQGQRAGTVSGGGTASLSFQPTQAFAPGEPVSVTVPATVLSTNGTATRPEVYQFTAAAGTGPADFAGGPTVPVPAAPAGVATGDVDNDGDTDLVVPDVATARVLLNDGSGSFTLAPGLTAPAGGEIRGLALADVDADGQLDILTTGNGILDTWHNTGSGFTHAASLTLGGSLGTPVLADLDADGDLDVLLTNVGYRTVQVRLNDGTGSFGGGTDVPMASGGVYSIAVADLDNDGDLDFVGAATIVGNYSNGVTNVRLNAGNGTFASAPDLSTGALSNAVALGDLDGDGDADLVVSNQIQASNVLLNTGNGTFTSAPDVPGRDTNAVTLADVDGDGDLDLLRTMGRYNLVSLSLNDGTGHFAAGRVVRVGSGAYNLAVADFDGDQALDVVTANQDGNSLSVRFNRIPAPTIAGFAPGSGPVGSSVAVTGTGFGTTTTVLINGRAADFVVNGAGSLTATVPAGATSGQLTVTTAGGTAVSSASFTVTGPPAPVVLSTSPGRQRVGASPAGPVTLTFSQPLAAATAGELRVWGNRSSGRRLEAVGGGGTATLSMQPARAFRPGEVVQVSVPPGLRGSNGAAARPEVYQFTTASGPGKGTFVSGGNVAALANPTQLRPADLDGDGDLDLVAEVATGLQIFTNDGRGNFSPGAVILAYNRPQYGNPYAVAMADVDNDGDLDIVGAGSYYRNNGGGSFTNLPLAGLVGGGGVKVGDVDGDGDLDVVAVRVESGEGLLVRNDGAGAFGPASGFSLGSGTSQVELADVDADGDLDVLGTNRTDNTVTLGRNDGRGTFGTPVVVATALDLVDLKLADLDGDGDPDLVFGTRADPAGNTIGVCRNDGQGNFTGPALTQAYSNMFEFALRDLNGDNRPDLVLAASNEVRTLLNDGNGGFSAPTQLPANGNPSGLSVEDYNGDGALDIVGVAFNIGTNQPLLLLNQLPPPIIISFTPTFGLAGTVVTVTGQYFINVLNMELNGVQVSNLVVNSPTSITFTVPAGATTGYIYVYTDHGTGSSNSPFNVTSVPPDLDVYGPMDVTGTYNNVTIYQYYGTVANLVGPLTVTGTLTVRGGGTLLTNCQPITGPGNFVMQPYATLSVCDPAGISSSGPTGAIQLTGARTFATGYYTYNGSQAQVTGNGLPTRTEQLAIDNPSGLTLTQPVALAARLTLTHGNLTTNGQALTLLSVVNQQAWVDNADGAVLGPATVQRFVLPFRNPGLGYRHFSPPTTNATVNSLTTSDFAPVVNTVYNASPTPGQVRPFPTVFGYDQARTSTVTSSYGDFDKGWVSPAALTDPLLPGRGYSVNLSGGRTVAFTGPLTNGPVVLPLTRAATPVADGGWQLLGNPYPSPLDWSRVTLPPEVEPALYIFRSSSPYGGTYSRYVNGIGNPVVDVAQGFFVRMAQPSTSATLTLTNAARRVDVSPNAFQRTTADPRPQLPLRLTDVAGRADEVIVYFEAGATAAFAPAFDARQLATNSGGEPSLWALASTGEALSIYGLPPVGTGTTRVPLGVALPQAGTFTFAAPGAANLGGLSAWLDDAATGTTTRLDRGGSYVFQAAAGTLAGRFTLRFGPPQALATLAPAARGLQLYPNPARMTVWLERPAGATAATLTLRNALGQAVRTYELPAGAGPQVLDLAGLAPGVYGLHLPTPQGPVTQRLLVE